ncbi:hypothetical protein RMATCC62417_09646 [Rhizopus microsporus]|nr:hypothetical protein RMATCC62417_09646 [Rhizopus microsporus]
MTKYCFIIRHGERLDHVHKLCKPDLFVDLWDPPITPKGLYQAEQTGERLVELMEQNRIDPKTMSVVIYTSPFQRCIETSIGIIKGMRLKKAPILRLDVGLGEWMCERFFDSVGCQATEFVSRQYQFLARQQANAYAKRNDIPVMNVDYGYIGSRSEFEFPEHYTDMVQRFEEARRYCLEKANHATVVLFVTHAVGVNALLDGFRNHLTRPQESNYCSISFVCKKDDEHSENSDQSDEDSSEYLDTSTPWSIKLTMSDTHLTA